MSAAAERIKPPGLHIAIDQDLTQPLPTGHGNTLVLTGWCFHDSCHVTGIRIKIGNALYPARAIGLPRPDLKAIRPRGKGSVARSGFVATVPLFPSRSQSLPLAIVARLSQGSQLEVDIGTIS